MRCLQSIMATASLSATLWRASAVSPRSLAALTSTSTRASARPSSAFSRRRPSPLSRSRRSNNFAGLAFQNGGGAFSRTPIATAFSKPSLSTSTSTALKSSTSPQAEETIKKPIPTILLAGFLGSGKTSTLKHLLENNSNIKIGTIVNDVASVNIDAKLISNSDSQNDANSGSSYAEGGVVELQNGCACCSLADELFDSIVKLTNGGQRELDAIVVELSGVADPKAVRDNWEQAHRQGNAATRIANLSRTVTLVDACTFGTDWLTFDTAGERQFWTEEGDDCTGTKKVPELLAEQVEAADLLLVNKIDLAGEKQVGVASGVARGLNDKASIMEVEFGRVDARELLGKMLGDELEEKEEEKEVGHSHDHEHKSHDHGHDHEASSEACTEPACTDTSHSHAHEHAASSDCSDPDCTDDSHSHSHEHTAECDDADCTDTSHAHTHDHKTSTETAASHLGITSFVYKTSTPFNSQRLLGLLNRWPVPIKDTLDFGLVKSMSEQDGKLDENVQVLDEHRAFVGVLRSKGFCWMAPTKWGNGAGCDTWRHDTAMYWSHAGKHFGITSAGKWWGSLSKQQMKPYFANNEGEYDRIMREDWISEEWGDRRQELVFIGAGLDEDEIREALDECLCTEDEMVVYRAQLRNYLDAMFSSATDGPSLFDVGATDHLDQ